ncbi:hypothetical protein RIR_jg22506.t1 [Rhizophagus irregularis DAOM 181602=DAOM 197198]|nr:hypothetical protein RIR_jg22506.t1 [Rhizophagus irregularis DAOM 181602=DAOM 197198]
MDNNEFNLQIVYKQMLRIRKVYVAVYPDEQLLCPYAACNDTFIATSPWKLTDEQKRALFLIPKEPHTPASVDTIANWIKSILRISSPGSHKLSSVT